MIDLLWNRNIEGVALLVLAKLGSQLLCIPFIKLKGILSALGMGNFCCFCCCIFLLDAVIFLFVWGCFLVLSFVSVLVCFICSFFVQWLACYIWSKHHKKFFMLIKFSEAEWMFWQVQSYHCYENHFISSISFYYLVCRSLSF